MEQGQEEGKHGRWKQALENDAIKDIVHNVYIAYIMYTMTLDAIQCQFKPQKQLQLVPDVGAYNLLADY